MYNFQNNKTMYIIIEYNHKYSYMDKEILHQHKTLEDKLNKNKLDNNVKDIFPIYFEEFVREK